MALPKLTLVNWIKSVSAGGAFLILIYVLLPSITLLNVLTHPTNKQTFVLILTICPGIPVAIFGIWLEIKSIATRIRNIQEKSDG